MVRCRVPHALFPFELSILRQYISNGFEADVTLLQRPFSKKTLNGNFSDSLRLDVRDFETRSECILIAEQSSFQFENKKKKVFRKRKSQLVLLHSYLSVELDPLSKVVRISDETNPNFEICFSCENYVIVHAALNGLLEVCRYIERYVNNISAISSNAVEGMNAAQREASALRRSMSNGIGVTGRASFGLVPALENNDASSITVDGPSSVPMSFAMQNAVMPNAVLDSQGQTDNREPNDDGRTSRAKSVSFALDSPSVASPSLSFVSPSHPSSSSSPLPASASTPVRRNVDVVLASPAFAENTARPPKRLAPLANLEPQDRDNLSLDEAIARARMASQEVKRELSLSTLAHPVHSNSAPQVLPAGDRPLPVLSSPSPMSMQSAPQFASTPAGTERENGHAGGNSINNNRAIVGRNNNNNSNEPVVNHAVENVEVVHEPEPTIQVPVLPVVDEPVLLRPTVSKKDANRAQEVEKSLGEVELASSFVSQNRLAAIRKILDDDYGSNSFVDESATFQVHRVAHEDSMRESHGQVFVQPSTPVVNRVASSVSPSPEFPEHSAPPPSMQPKPFVMDTFAEPLEQQGPPPPRPHSVLSSPSFKRFSSFSSQSPPATPSAPPLSPEAPRSASSMQRKPPRASRQDRMQYVSIPDPVLSAVNIKPGAYMAHPPPQTRAVSRASSKSVSFADS